MVKVIPFIYNDIDDLFSNTYVVCDEDNKAIVIDPSVDNDKLSNYLVKNNLSLQAVLLTHGHFDHIRGVDHLIDTFNCPLFIFYLDEEMLYDARLNCSSMMSNNGYVIKNKASTLKDKEVLHLLKEDIYVMHTPFHTIGSTCYYFKESKILFSGDTLFKGGIGRYDLPNSDRRSVQQSLNTLYSLDGDIKVYPGHGPSTFIKDERPK